MYSIFELEALQAQEKSIKKRTGDRTACWTEYCKMCRDGVLVDNYMEGDGPLRVEKGNEEEAKSLQKKAKTSAKSKAVPAPKNQRLQPRMRGHRENDAERSPRKRRRSIRRKISRETKPHLVQ